MWPFDQGLLKKRYFYRLFGKVLTKKFSRLNLPSIESCIVTLGLWNEHVKSRTLGQFRQANY